MLGPSALRRCRFNHLSRRYFIQNSTSCGRLDAVRRYFSGNFSSISSLDGGNSTWDELKIE